MQNAKARAAKRAILVLFILYALAMLFLLILPNNYRRHNVFIGGLSWARWSDYVAREFNLVPFRGIAQQIGEIVSGEHVARNSIYLVGNLIGFAPLGFFLPALFAKQRKFKAFLCTTLLLLVCVELVQLMTLRGSFDIDDVMLNSIGACIGFWLLRKWGLRLVGAMPT